MDYNKRAEPLKSSHTWADMYNTSWLARLKKSPT
jgi:hypothetical protein